MKKNKGYKIISINSRGFVEFLSRDSQWYIASNDCLFRTLSDARSFFKTAKYELRGSSIWIEGPKGGTHGLFDR